MRICLYTCTALPKLGGQEAVVDALARHLQRLGHEPTVLAPRPRWPARTDDAALPYPVIRHPRFVSTVHLVGWYGRFLRRAHRDRRFDLVHCHDVYPTGYLATRAKPALGVPVVITSHGGDVRPGNRLLAKPVVARRIYDALNGADALVSIGRFTSDGYQQIAGVAEHVVTIPNGVDYGSFQQPVGRPADLDRAIVPRRFVLFIGRLAERKGLDTLLAGLSRLSHVTGLTGVELVVAGTGDERASWERRATELGVAAHVRFVGRADGDRKRWLLQNATAVAVPSRGWEAFPLVVLEAYAAGRPVLASRIVGLEDRVDDGATGLLVAPGDADGWAAALAHARGDPAWCDAAGTVGRRVAAGHDWNVIAERHVELYERVIRQPR